MLKLTNLGGMGMAAAGPGMQIANVQSACTGSLHLASYIPRGGAQKSYPA